LSEALWFEAASEPLEGKVAVLDVIHNRKIHKNYPDSYCGVIHQKYQFSYRNHLRKGQTMIKTPSNALERKVAMEVSTLAFAAATGRLKPSLPPSVIFYHAASIKVQPKWTTGNKFCAKCKMKSKNPRLYAKIGNHHFYRS